MPDATDISARFELLREQGLAEALDSWFLEEMEPVFARWADETGIDPLRLINAWLMLAVRFGPNSLPTGDWDMVWKIAADGGLYTQVLQWMDYGRLHGNTLLEQYLASQESVRRHLIAWARWESGTI